MTKQEKGELHDIIENEGFEYTFIHYLNIDDWEDQELRRLVKEYNTATGNLMKYIEWEP